MRRLLDWLFGEPPVRVAARQPVPFVTTRHGGVTIEGYRDEAHAARVVAAWWHNQETAGLTTGTPRRVA